MQLAPIPNNEFTRTQALRNLNILDSTSDIRVDLITHYASHTLNTPISTVTLIDTNRQWFKSDYGVQISELPRSIAICAHAIYEIKSKEPNKRLFEVSNTINDLRFTDNSFVAQSPSIRSYISYVIQSRCGENIGTFCIADNEPRLFSDQERQLVITLDEMYEELINSYYDYTLTQTHSTNL